MTEQKKAKHAGGRPSKFTMHLMERILHCARYGMTDAEIAWVFGVDDTSIGRWKEKSEVFRAKYEAAKENSDGIIEGKLFQRANGMKVTERIVKKLTVGDKAERTEQTLVERELAPDPAAIRLWLINRRPDKWKDKGITIGAVVDNRQQLMINFNAAEVAEIILNEYGERSKAIADAVASVIGIPVERDSSNTPQALCDEGGKSV